jgi:hypothetical protein
MIIHAVEKPFIDGLNSSNTVSIQQANKESERASTSQIYNTVNKGR